MKLTQISYLVAKKYKRIKCVQEHSKLRGEEDRVSNASVLVCCYKKVDTKQACSYICRDTLELGNLTDCLYAE